MWRLLRTLESLTSLTMLKLLVVAAVGREVDLILRNGRGCRLAGMAFAFAVCIIAG